jgi:hypothetical protein
VSAWEEIRELILAVDERRLADRVIALDAAGRAEVARRLPGFLKELRDPATRPAWRPLPVPQYLDEDADEWPAWVRESNEQAIRWRTGDPMEDLEVPLRIAGAGTISGPAAVAAWLARREFNRGWAPPLIRIAELMRVLTARPAEWQADVAARLARRIRTAGDRNVPLTLRLLRACGADPPGHDPLVVAWVSYGPRADDPLLDPLLPRIFEAEGAGRALRDAPLGQAWLDLIMELLAAGRVSREWLIDACVGRFLRGGSLGDLRFFTRLHELIDPAPQEVADRARDYLRLLPAAPAPVAESALTRLRRTGPIDTADAAEAITALAFRAEAKLVRAGLSWLEERIRLAPGDAAGPAKALAAAFGHTSRGVQERAARIALRHAAVLAPAAEVIAEAVGLLPADLGAPVAERFGGEAAPDETAEPFTPPPLPAVEAPGPLPAPRPQFPGFIECDHPDPGEAWLAFFVARATTNRGGLRAQLVVRARHYLPSEEKLQRLYQQERWSSVDDWLTALAMEVVAPGSDPGPPEPRRADPRDGAGRSARQVERFYLRLREAGLPADLAARWCGHLFALHPWPSAFKVVNGKARARPPADAELVDRVREEMLRQAEALFDHALAAGLPAELAAMWSGQLFTLPSAVGEIEMAYGEAPARLSADAGLPGDIGEAISRRAALCREEISRQAALLRDAPAFTLSALAAGWRDGVLAAAPRQPGDARTEPRFPLPGSVPGLREPEPSDPMAEYHRRHRLPEPGGVSPLKLFLLYRLSELYTALREDRLPPVLLATPTLTTGHLDPEVLVDRLETCAAAGVEPLQADLCQALLRLPRGPHPEAAARAARVGSAAASAAAAWLAEGGLPDPETGVRWAYNVGGAERVVAEPEPERAGNARPVPVLRAKPTGHELIDGLLREPPPQCAYPGVEMNWWPSMLPSHREVVAVNLLPFLRPSSALGEGRRLQALLAADGPVGDGTAAILAFVLTRDPARGWERTEAVPLLLAAAARGVLPAEAVGRHLAIFLRMPDCEHRTVVAALTEAARQGAHREVWRILTTLLPAFLPSPGERAALAHIELVALAAKVAAWTGARGEIPVIARHVASGRRNRFVRECVRLHHRLTGTAPANR